MLATSIRNLPKRAKICNDTPSISIESLQLSVEQSVRILVATPFSCLVQRLSQNVFACAQGLDFHD